MNTQIGLAISVVIYKNNYKMLEKLFDSILGSKLKLKVFVIDNSPNNQIEEMCKKEGFTYIHTTNNIGFGAGHNIAIKKNLNMSKYHLVVNPDIYFEKRTLEKIYNFMEENPDIGLVIPKVLYPDGSLQYLYRLLPTPFNIVIRRLRIPFFSNYSDFVYELKFADYNKITDIPYLSGCFMFIRTEVFHKVGVFDERFFMYFEDVDLSRRIHKYFRTVYYPKAIIYHGYEKGSNREFNLLKLIIYSGIKYFNKWGWFFDKERRLINSGALRKIKRL